MRRLHLLTFVVPLLSALACNDVTSPPSPVNPEAGAARAQMAIGAQGGIWNTMAPMPTARNGVATGVIAGKLYVVSGAPVGGFGSTTVEVFDPTLNTWTTRAPIPTNRAYASAGVIDGKLYVVGGCVNGDCSSSTNKLEVYDPATNTWTTKTPMPTARAAMATGVIGGKLYVAGGFAFCSGACPDFNTLEVYDPATNSWTTKAPMPTARSHVDGAAINGKLYVVGGTTDGTDLGGLATLEVYDPSTNAWTTKAPMPTPRHALGAGEVNDILYAVSGVVAGYGNVNTVEAYNPATDTWITVAPIPTARYGPRPRGINGVLYVAGNGPGNTPISTLEAFTPEGMDLTPPQTTINSAVDGNGAAIASGEATLSSSIAFTFEGTDNVGVVGFQCSLDAAPYVACSSPATYSALAVGAHTFQVRAMDAAGNVAGPASFAWAVVNSATNTTLSSAPDPSDFGQSVTFTATVTKASDATAVTTGTVDFIEGGTCASPTATLASGAGLNGGGQATFSTSAFAIGSHTVSACYSGATGFNQSDGSDTQTVQDNTAPVTTINSAVDGNGAAIASGEATLSSSIAFTFQGTDAVGVVGFQCSLDAAPYVTCSSPATYSALAVGTHTFQVRAMDAAGNVAIPASFAWTVVTPAQAIQSLITTVTSMGLPAGVANSLSAPLKNIDTNNLAAACGKLNAFVNQINAKVQNGQLTMPQSSELLQAANAIKASLGCA